MSNRRRNRNGPQNPKTEKGRPTKFHKPRRAKKPAKKTRPVRDYDETGGEGSSED